MEQTLILMKLFFMDLWLTLLWSWTVASIWLFMGVLTKKSESIWRAFSAHVFSREEIKLNFQMSQLKTQMQQIWSLWVKIDMLAIILIPNLKTKLCANKWKSMHFNFHHTQTHTALVLWKPLLTSCLLARTLLAPNSRHFKWVNAGNCTRTLILCMYKNKASLSFHSSN